MIFAIPKDAGLGNRIFAVSIGKDRRIGFQGEPVIGGAEFMFKIKHLVIADYLPGMGGHTTHAGHKAGFQAAFNFVVRCVIANSIKQVLPFEFIWIGFWFIPFPYKTWLVGAPPDLLYLLSLGSAVGPHPYPVMVRDFQSVIGKEIKKQMKNVPDTVIACVGGGSNAIGTFYPMIDDGVEMIGVEAAGKGLKTGMHSATLNAGKKGVLHGMMTYLLQDNDGQIKETHSISAGLDYPGVGPEHAFLKDSGNVKYKSATDNEVIDAFLTLTKTEGIIPALESAHAISHAIKIAKTRSKSDSIVVTLSGRGDKDIDIVKQYLRKNVKNSR